MSGRKMASRRRARAVGKHRSTRRARAVGKHRSTPRKTDALMRIKAPPNQPWNLTLDEVALVKNHIAKGATDKELEFCLAVARRHKLDPFRGQIWFVQRKDKTAEGGYRWIPITGINGMLHIAARDHRDFGSNDEPEFGSMHPVKWRWNGEGQERTLQAPEWAKIRLWKKGHDHPIVATVFWDEIYPNVDYSPLVRQMPRLMLGKCALAQAVRRAYPATDGLYIKEEFQGPPEFTPGGRVMEVIPKIAEAEKNWERREAEGMERLTPDQRKIVEDKMAKAKSSPPVKHEAPAEKAAASVESHAKPTGDNAAADSLFYVETPSGLYELLGSDVLLKAHKNDLLTFLDQPASKAARARLLQPEQLGKLIRWCERSKVPIRALESSHE